jgi:YjbE family integral membrane protein
MFAELITAEQLTILGQIIFIDLVLAGDNAIIIGMVASKFPAEQRKKIIFWGIGGAVILRIILTLLTAYLLQITGLRLVGGLLLLYIVYKLYVDVIKGSGEEDDIKVDNSNFLKAIWTILLADFTMSLDNVLGVAGAAGDHYTLLIFGLILSIVLMATVKTKSSAKKRFKLTGSGKIKRKHAFKSHILTKKATKRKRNLTHSGLVHEGDEGNVKIMLTIGK